MPLRAISVARQLISQPGGVSLMDVVMGLADGLPSGLYTGGGIESYLHKVLSEPGRTDDFGELDCELYLTATDLDTCERVVLGVDGSDDVPISTAVRASGALPMVYAPVQVNDRELIDGGMVSTTNLDLAIQAGAKLVVVINPIVPFINDFGTTVTTLRGRRPRRCLDMGFAQIGYQVFKLVAHQRLHELAKSWEERYPGVDIVLIEPEPTDELMFQTSMMSFTSRVEIARHGFESVTKKLAGEYERYQDVAERHGLEISAERVREVVEHFDEQNEEVSAWRKILEGTTGALLRRRARGRSPQRTLSTASSRRSVAWGETRPMRTWPGSPSASPAATSTPDCARRAAALRPAGWGGRPTGSWPAQSLTSKPRWRSAALMRGRSAQIVRTRRSVSSRAAAKRLERPRLGDLRDAEVGLELGEQLLGLGRADRIADPHTREAPRLGEAAEHEQARMALEQRRARRPWAGRRRTPPATRPAAPRRPRAARRAAVGARRWRAARRLGRWGSPVRSRGRLARPRQLRVARPRRGSSSATRCQSQAPWRRPADRLAARHGQCARTEAGRPRPAGPSPRSLLTSRASAWACASNWWAKTTGWACCRWVIPGAGGGQVLGGLGEQCGLQLGYPGSHQPGVISQVKPQVGGDLVVPAAACPQLATERSDPFEQATFQRRVHVLVGDRRAETAVPARPGEAVQRAEQAVEFGVVQQPRAMPGTRACAREASMS